MQGPFQHKAEGHQPKRYGVLHRQTMSNRSRSEKFLEAARRSYAKHLILDNYCLEAQIQPKTKMCSIAMFLLKLPHPLHQQLKNPCCSQLSQGAESSPPKRIQGPKTWATNWLGSNFNRLPGLMPCEIYVNIVFPVEEIHKLNGVCVYICVRINQHLSWNSDSCLKCPGFLSSRLIDCCPWGYFRGSTRPRRMLHRCRCRGCCRLGSCHQVTAGKMCPTGIRHKPWCENVKTAAGRAGSTSQIYIVYIYNKQLIEKYNGY